ncbi:hypothetical protein SmJEL517_g01803 [Synchytrium microbalum]|uniref:Dymeclin n=1 Tax=Synchytrium microbalum TaxID=1806994 RepID=A0A507C8E5_9FUNG|nr:uncharacterized protein SmJEL517_g01803 [Synchytrium microbalum]TPX35892.1 hypothetical protein SmJEL517_g01803 [Synchytrium microbalum]
MANAGAHWFLEEVLPAMGAAESKLQLRKNVFQLHENKKINPRDYEFFDPFFYSPETSEDVHNLFAPADIKKTRDTAPENLVTLLTKCVEHILTFTNSTEPFDKEVGKRVINAVRILTRILPYIFEVPQSPIEENLFWKAEGADGGLKDTLGAKLCTAVVKLLFIRGFTLPDYVSDHNGLQYVIWAPGLGVNVGPNSTREVDCARIETMRLFLVLLSHGMYVVPTELLNFDNRWASVFVTGLERRAVLAVLCSLLNTAMNYDPNSWTFIPYNHILFSDIQEQLVTLCLQTLTVLLDYKAVARVIASKDLENDSDDDDEEAAGEQQHSGTEGSTEGEVTKAANADKPPSSPTKQSKSAEPSTQPPTNDVTRHNDFQYYMSRMYRVQDSNFVLTGITRLIRNPIDSANVYLPGSTKRVSLYAEVLMLLWKLLEVNERFSRYTMENDKVLVLLTSMLYFVLDGKSDPTQLGVIRLCCFLIHILSQDRNFAVQLNTSFDPAGLAGPVMKLLPVFGAGCYGDFLILSIHHIITTTSRTPIATLHENFMITMTNISPYIKSLTVVTSNKLLSLFQSFSNPAFLLSAEPNHKLVFYMIETLNNLIQFQVAGNSQLVYSLIRAKDKVVSLNDLTYTNALAELTRIREAKAAKASQGTPGTLSKSSSTTATDELSEKAKGKLPSTGSEESLPPSTPTTTHKNRFQPSKEWFDYWKKHLPLAVLLSLIDTLGPQIEAFCVERGLNDEKQVVQYLQSGTLVGLLPLPQPILVRRFHYNDPIRVWFSSFLWGAIFLKSGNRQNAEIGKLCPSVWTGTVVKLFNVKITE